MFLGKPSLYNWSDSVKNKLAGQVIAGRYFRLSGRLFMPLRLHNAVAFQPQANPGF